MEVKMNEFQELKESMDRFVDNIEEALTLQRKNIAKKTESFKSGVVDLHKQEKSLTEQLQKEKNDIESIKSKIDDSKGKNIASKEKYEDYEIRKNKLTQMKSQLLKESIELDDMVSQKEKLVQDYRERLHAQSQRDNSEVKLYEDLLGMIVDTSTPGTLLFTFKNFHDKDPNKSCSMTLEVSGEKFKILQTTPLLTNVTEIEDILNKSNNLPVFIMKSRELLISRVQ